MKYAIVHTDSNGSKEVFDVFEAENDKDAVKEFGQRSGTSWSSLYRAKRHDQEGSRVTRRRTPIAIGTLSGFMILGGKQ